MGLSPKQQQERKNDAHVQEIVKRMNESLQKREPDKYYAKGEDYIFISYKSDDWKIVLHDIVYELVTKYGLRVYFDGSFDDHNPIWVNQFPNNMKTPNCKGVLAFIDDKYTTSYATLMELMYSQTRQASVGGKKDGEKLPVVTINLFGTLKSPDSEKGIEDTGLGRDRFPDGSVNSNATKEKEIFDRTFNELVRRNILKDKIEWYQDNELYNRGCHEIMVELISTLEVNQNDYIPEVTVKESFCKSLTATIRDAVGDSVFGKIVPESPCFSETPVSLDAFVSQEPKQQPCPAEEEEQEKPATEGERTYRVKGKGDKYDALLTVTEDSRYIVRKGSKVAESWQEWIGRKDIAEKSGKVGDDCILLEHVEFHAISAAAKFIKGCSTSGADIVNPKNLAHDIAKDDREIPDMREVESTTAPESEKIPDVSVSAGTEINMESGGEITTETFALPEFVSGLSSGNFKKDSFRTISLIGRDGCKRYSVLEEDNTAVLVWHFMMRIIEERGEACIQELAAKSRGKNPAFMKTEAYNEGKKNGQISVNYKTVDRFPEWSMCCNYSQADWLKVLRDRITDLGFSQEDFSIELTGYEKTKKKRVAAQFTRDGKTYHDGGLNF